MNLRRALYLTQRTMSDIDAVQRQGPVGLGKRVVRRRIRRGVGRQLNRWGL